ncbi:TPA: hypothetical protein UON70_003665 [Clostridioides difficile]|nr:hypothetical protein [Clostridioides difficile]
MENINFKIIVDRIKGGEYLSDIADQLNTNTYTILRMIHKDEDAQRELMLYLNDEKINGKKEKSILKELKKEIKDLELIHKIINDVNSGSTLKDIARSDYVSSATYSKLLNGAGYRFDRVLGGYTHPLFKEAGEYVRLMNSMDLEERVETLFKALYYEYIEDDGDVATCEEYNFQTKEIQIYHKLYDELLEMSKYDGYEMFEDFIHYIFLNYVYKRTGRDDTNKNLIQYYRDVTGFTTDEEIKILKKYDFDYEKEEAERDLASIYKSYLIKNGYKISDLEGLDCWHMFREFHKLIDKK